MIESGNSNTLKVSVAHILKYIEIIYICSILQTLKNLISDSCGNLMVSLTTYVLCTPNKDCSQCTFMFQRISSVSGNMAS